MNLQDFLYNTKLFSKVLVHIYPFYAIFLLWAFLLQHKEKLFHPMACDFCFAFKKPQGSI